MLINLPQLHPAMHWILSLGVRALDDLNGRPAEHLVNDRW
jgi:hypothetical protein